VNTVGFEAAGGGAAQAGVAEAVVHVTLIRIRENRVRLRGFLEFVFRFLAAGIAVGMVLERELAVRALDLLLGRGFVTSRIS
jgi:hypothetical protein